MTRYFFDMREGTYVTFDDEGMELPTIQAAREEAALALADIVRDIIRKRGDATRHALEIDVRDEAGPVLKATVVFHVNIHRE